jgi:hypothetical protein
MTSVDENTQRTTEVPGWEEAPYEEPPADVSPSMMERLRARRAAIAGEHTVRMPIPGFAGELLAEYKKLSYDTTRAIARRAAESKNPRADLYGQMDILINACVGIYSNTGEKVSDGYTLQLAEFFGMGEVKTARTILLELFQNDLAIPAHHSDVMTWMQDSDQLVNEQLAGE